MSQVHGKLVRDRIPDLIAATGARPVYRRLASDEEYLAALFAKATEELAELRAATGPDRLAELADVTEVLAAVAAAFGYSPAEVGAAVAAKRAGNGGFAERIWLDRVEP